MFRKKNCSVFTSVWYPSGCCWYHQLLGCAGPGGRGRRPTPAQVSAQQCARPEGGGTDCQRQKSRNRSGGLSPFPRPRSRRSSPAVLCSSFVELRGCTSLHLSAGGGQARGTLYRWREKAGRPGRVGDRPRRWDQRGGWGQRRAGPVGLLLASRPAPPPAPGAPFEDRVPASWCAC